MNYKLILSHI